MIKLDVKIKVFACLVVAGWVTKLFPVWESVILCYLPSDCLARSASSVYTLSFYMFVYDLAVKKNCLARITLQLT